MGFFTILQKGILLLFQSWVWCTTPRATCFFFSAHFHHHLLLPCFNQPPPLPPQKKDPCFPAKCSRFQPNPTNQGFARKSESPHRRPLVCRLRCTCLSCSSCEEIMWMPLQNWTERSVWCWLGGLIFRWGNQQAPRDQGIANDHLLFWLFEVNERCIFSLQCHSWFWLQINIHPRSSDLLWKLQVKSHHRSWQGLNPQSYTNRPWNIGPVDTWISWYMGQKLWVVRRQFAFFPMESSVGNLGLQSQVYCIGPHDFQDNCWTDVPLLAEEQWVFNQHLASRSCM